MPSRFIRLTQAAVGTTRTQIGAYTVPTATTTIIVGSAFTNLLTTDITLTLEQGVGTAFFVLGPKAVIVKPGQAWTLADLGKIVLAAGDTLNITANAASAADVAVSLMEIS